MAGLHVHSGEAGPAHRPRLLGRGVASDEPAVPGLLLHHLPEGQNRSPRTSRSGRTCRRRGGRNMSDVRGWAPSPPGPAPGCGPSREARKHCGSTVDPRGPWPPQRSAGDRLKGAGGLGLRLPLTSPALPGAQDLCQHSSRAPQDSSLQLPTISRPPRPRPGACWVRILLSKLWIPGQHLLVGLGPGPASRILPLLGSMKLRSEVVRLAGPLSPR